jgi:LmbE family N-acetylglucosaminyl deacetylase
MSRILVVAAHPDDEVLGCGGTIARLADQGHKIHVLILGEGMTSRSVQRADADPSLVQQLRRTTSDVAALLGARSVSTHDLPDNRFDTVPLLEIIKIVEASVNELAPETVYTHHWSDLNVDHSITCRATLTATRPIRGRPVGAVYSYEVPSSTEWTFGAAVKPFLPNVFVDVSGYLNVKIGAMRLYVSEMRAYPHPRSEEAMRANARRWGSHVGLEAAEAFELVRSIV